MTKRATRNGEHDNPFGVRVLLAERLGNESIYSLAKRAGIRYMTAYDFYHNRNSRLDYETLGKICVALGCEPGDLLKMAN